MKVMGIVESDKPLSAEYNPDHPLANEEGYIYKPNVNVMEEMASLIRGLFGGAGETLLFPF